MLRVRTSRGARQQRAAFVGMPARGDGRGMCRGTVEEALIGIDL